MRIECDAKSIGSYSAGAARDRCETAANAVRKRVLEYAGDEIRLMNEQAVGPEHLLLGLLREPDGAAGQALRNLGLQLGNLVHEVFRTRIELMKTVERAVRPVHAGTPWKRKTREELLAHLTTIYDEEKQRASDPATAMAAAIVRFGDPGELAHELETSLSTAERRQYFVERWFGWRAPESAARYMVRQAIQSFSILAVACAVIAAGTFAFAGFHGNIGTIVRGPIAFLVLTPLAQFLLGLFYYRMRDAIHGPTWASKSKPKAVLFGILIGVSFFTAALAFIGIATWDVQRVVDALLPIAAASMVIAVAHFVLARRRGPTEIADTLWACMNLDDGSAPETA